MVSDDNCNPVMRNWVICTSYKPHSLLLKMKELVLWKGISTIYLETSALLGERKVQSVGDDLQETPLGQGTGTKGYWEPRQNLGGILFSLLPAMGFQ